MAKHIAAIFCIAAFTIAMFAGNEAEARSCYFAGGSIEVLVCTP